MVGFHNRPLTQKTHGDCLPPREREERARRDERRLTLYAIGLNRRLTKPHHLHSESSTPRRRARTRTYPHAPISSPTPYICASAHDAAQREVSSERYSERQLSKEDAKAKPPVDGHAGVTLFRSPRERLTGLVEPRVAWR